MLLNDWFVGSTRREEKLVDDSNEQRTDGFMQIEAEKKEDPETCLGPQRKRETSLEFDRLGKRSYGNFFVRTKQIFGSSIVSVCLLKG